MPRILLLGNYPGDGQHSMLRYARMLRDELSRLGCHVDIVQPPVVVGDWGRRGRLRSGDSDASIQKWLGYVDKYVFFPRQLESLSDGYDIVHIADHSNAVYVPWIKYKPTVVTCHDMLAVRGALGEDTSCPASPTGKILQRWILHGLSRATERVCVSDYTHGDVIRLLGKNYESSTVTIKNWLEDTMGVVPREEALQRLASLQRSAATHGVALHSFNADEPFILHVGSNLPRKNRDGVIRIFSLMKDRFPGKLVFAGSALPDELRDLATKRGVMDRIVEIVRPEDKVIEALYNLAFAFVFPSKFEGFGWPLIEAQACGCPVVCGSNPPLPEVVGDSAITVDLNNEQGFADALVSLMEAGKREAYREKGFENIKQYSAAIAARKYLDLYKRLLTAATHGVALHS